jgi:hypothetical protein
MGMISGNRTQQARSIRDTDAVDGWGRFQSAKLELQYRQQQAAYDAFQSKVFVIVVVLASLALALTDYRLFGFSPLFWRLIAVRLGFAFISFITIVVLQRGLPAQQLHRIVLAWSLLLVTVNISIASTRPPNYLIQAILNVSTVLMCYFLLPLPLMLQIIPSILMSMGNIALVAWLNTPADQLTGTAIIVAFVVVNLLGVITARQIHYWKRQQFVALLRQTELRASLEHALAEIKTLRGILPICSHCKRVRDDSGYWQQVEVYVRDRTYAEFSHSICPACLQTHYEDLLDA